MSTVAEILVRHGKAKGALIPILQEIQDNLGYLTPDAIFETAKFTGISESEIYGVASFYSQFYFTPRGKHTVKVCLGTACHVRGGQRIMNEVENELQISPGETTPDANFSLDKVVCFGSCALGPVMVVDQTVYGRMTPTRITDILDLYKKD